MRRSYIIYLGLLRALRYFGSAGGGLREGVVAVVHSAFCTFKGW